MLSQKEIEKAVKESLRNQEELNRSGERDASRDAIQICPYAYFIEGTSEKPLKYLTGGRGRLTVNGLISLVNYMGGGGGTDTYSARFCWMTGFAVGSAGVPTVPSVRLGLGTTSTVYNVTQLENPLNTAPNAISGSISNPSAGTYRITLTATWNAGTIANETEITEAAFFAKVNPVLQGFEGEWSYLHESIQLIDRLCSTDGDFTTITVNSSNPLTFYYVIPIAFATPT